MKKRVMFVFCFVLVLSLAFVSASFFGNIFEKFTGKAIGIQEVVFNEKVEKVNEGFVEKVVEVEDEKIEEEFSDISQNLYTEDTPYYYQDGMIMQENLFGEELPKYKGYLIEFEGVPIAVKSLELEKEVVEEKKGFFFRIFGKVIFTGSSVQGNLDQYRNELNEENEKIKQRIGNKFLEEGKTLKIEKEFNVLFNGIYVDVSDSEAKLIEGVEGVKRISPNYEVKADLMDSVPLINADDVWELNKDLGRCVPSQRDNSGSQNNAEECLTGKGISIAIVDTGIDYTHDDLGGCFGEGCKVVDGYDFVNEDNDPMDDNGHGTHCAGIAAGKGVLDGVAPDAKLYAYKVMNSGGSGNWDEIIAGLERAVDPNQDGNFDDRVDVISMSLGGNGNPDDVISLVVDNVVEIGSVVVIAAGNSGSGEQTIGSPGTSRKAITVGASDKHNAIADFSSRGPVIWDNSQGELKSLIKPDVVAPGVEICSSQWENAWQSSECIDTEHTAISGTSMATPHVAGAVALLKQKNPDWSPQEIKMALRNTAVDIGEEVVVQGQGRIDVLDAIEVEERPMIAELLELDYFPNMSLNIYGTARGEGFEQYNVFIFKEDNWEIVCQQNYEIEDGFLCSVDTSDLIDGVYNIRLSVYGYDWVSEDYGIFEIKNTEIITPDNLQAFTGSFLEIENQIIFGPGENEIIGTVKGKDFENYSIEFCDESFLNCNAETISLVNGGQQIVENGTLGFFNATGIESGYYGLKLINYYNGNVNSKESRFYIESEMQEGWPKSLIFNFPPSPTPPSFQHQPVLADINGDGGKDIIIAYGFSVHAYNHDGSFLNGFPVDIFSSCIVQKGPAISDINKDGKIEIVVGDNCGNIHIFNGTGSYLNGWPKQLSSGLLGVVTLSDLNHDGFDEMLFVNQNSLEIFDINGNPFPGWPKQLNYFDFPMTSPGVGDLNNDDSVEIVVLTDKEIIVFDINGNPFPGWPKTFSYYGPVESHRVVSLVDLNHDGFLEILFSRGNLIHAYNFYGEEIPGWPIAIQDIGSYGIISYEVPVGDLDGEYEIGVSAKNEKCLFLYGEDGFLKENWPVCFYDNINNSYFYGKPFNVFFGNLKGDSSLEIFPSLFGNFIPWGDLPEVYSFNFDTFFTSNFPKKMDHSNFGDSLSIGDLDNDGDNEVVAFNFNYNLFVWDLEGESGNDEWPMFQHDPRHTGNYHACSDGTLPGQCGYPKPLFCEDRVFIDNCQECGCPDSSTCLSNGNCVESVGVVNGSAVVD